MKTLNQKLCPPPVLDLFMQGAIVETIKGHVKRIRQERDKRVEKIQNIRAMHQDDYSHRAKPGSIYNDSNIGVPLMKGVATSFASKLEDELFASESPFYVEPQNGEDRGQAERFSRYWKWELIEQCHYRAAASEVLDVLTSEGTAVCKRTWRTDRSYYDRVEAQLVDADGQPMIGPDGKPITQGDHPTKVIQDPVTGGKRRFLLFGEEQGPEITEQNRFEDFKVKDWVTHFDNAQTNVIPFEDFICDMTVADISLSDLVGHEFELKLHQVWEKVFQSIEGDETPEGLTNNGWIVDNLRNLTKLPDTPSVEVGQGGTDILKATAQAMAPKLRFGERRYSMMGIEKLDDAYKTGQFGEYHLRYDVDGDGYQEDLVILYDKIGEKILWCNHLVNVYADCQRPYVVHGFYRVPGRWWSMGPYEYLGIAQDFVDKVFNRMNFRTAMNANPMGWYKPENFVKPPKVWGPGERCELKKNENINDSIGFIAMPSLEQVEWQHFQFFISMIQLITGISNAAQGDIASLPSTTTATGITSIIEEGNKMYRKMIRRLQDSFTLDIGGLVRLIQQNLDRDRVFRYDAGMTDVIEKITPKEIRELDFDVRIVLSKHGGSQKAQSIQMALQIVQQFMTLPPENQMRFRPLYIQLLTIGGIVEAETVLPTVEELQAETDQDSMLNDVAQRIGAAAVQIQGGDLDPTKKVANDLLGIAQALVQLSARPPVPMPEGAVPMQMAPTGAAPMPSGAMPMPGEAAMQPEGMPLPQI